MALPSNGEYVPVATAPVATRPMSACEQWGQRTSYAKKNAADDAATWQTTRRTTRRTRYRCAGRHGLGRFCATDWLTSGMDGIPCLGRGGLSHVPGSVEARQAGVCAWPALTRYGVEKGIYFSYPCISRFGTLAPVLNLPVDPYSAEMMEKCPSSPHPPPCRWPLPNSPNGNRAPQEPKRAVRGAGCRRSPPQVNCHGHPPTFIGHPSAQLRPSHFQSEARLSGRPLRCFGSSRPLKVHRPSSLARVEPSLEAHHLGAREDRGAASGQLARVTGRLCHWQPEWPSAPLA
jgi:hypothetical protein